MTHPQVVVAVPARLESARLPGKLLAEIAGKPMLQHVLERCQQARGVAAVLVCTDSEQVRHLAQAWGVSVLMTSPDCSSGSERLASVVAELVAAAGGAASDFDETLVINVQGDQPLLDPGVIEAMVAQFELLQRPPLLTPVYPLAADKIHDPNVVKVLRARDGRAITFSRSALPHLRGVPPQQWGEQLKAEGQPVEFWFYDDAAHGLLGGPIHRGMRIYGSGPTAVRRYGWTGASPDAANRFTADLMRRIRATYP